MGDVEIILREEDEILEAQRLEERDQLLPACGEIEQRPVWRLRQARLGERDLGQRSPSARGRTPRATIGDDDDEPTSGGCA